MDTLMYSGYLKGRQFVNDTPKIKVVGVGAAGTNVIGALYAQGLQADLISINTDWTQLSAQHSDKKLLIGFEENQGKGCGGDHIKGRNAAKESILHIRSAIDGAEVLFLIGGLGNGTATGGLPVIAEEAKKQGALVVVFAIIPFFLKKSYVEKAEYALDEIEDYADTTIVLDLNHLTEVYRNLPLTEAFVMMNSLVAKSINTLMNLIRNRELMDIDLNHLKEVLKNGGYGTIGVSETEAMGDIDKLIQRALGDKLFHFDARNARRAIVQVAGGPDLSLAQIQTVANTVKEYTAPDADVVVGMHTDPSLQGKVRSTVILSGIPGKDVEIKKDIKDILKGLK